MANVELLKETLQYIKDNPQKWNQRVWYQNDTCLVPVDIEVEEVNSCGTAFCFAGHVAIRTGFPAPPKDNYASWFRVEENGKYTFVEQYAQEQLELSNDQADALFQADNSMDDLEWMVNEIISDPTVSGSYLMSNRPDGFDEDYCDCGCQDEYDEDEDY